MSARVHVGDIYGRLTVLERAPDHIQPSGFHKPVWKCQCSCEKKTILLVTSNRLLDKKLSYEVMWMFAKRKSE